LNKETGVLMAVFCFRFWAYVIRQLLWVTLPESIK